MSYAEEIRQRLNSGCTTKIRAVIYARVSTDNDGQKESCANQVELAMNFISRHPNIQLINTFVDDGISGKNDFTRPQYNEMLQLLVSDGFDLILTKALSRLNRNQRNSLFLSDLLLEHQATVLTLEDGQIHDFEDINTELLHSIKFVLDDQFVRQQSINGRKTHELRCKRKELSAKDCSFGYDWHREDKTITINQEQADIVRRIFEMYVYQSGTPASIHRTLQAEGINLCCRTISNIITDERYIGNFYINKRTTKLGMGQKKSKRIELPREQWILCERPDLQIIDRDLFDMAQRIRHSRMTVYTKPDKKTARARFQGVHKFAGKVFCPVCGKPYQFGYADRKKTRVMYRVRNHSECSSPIRGIYEDDLERITEQALKQVIDGQNEICDSLEQILTDIIKESPNSGDKIDKLKKQRVTKENQVNNLIMQLSEGGLTEAAKSRIKGRINQIEDEINSLTSIIDDKETNRLDDSYVADKLSVVRNAITELRKFNSVDRDRILNYVDRIVMQPDGDIEILLRSGHIIKKKYNNNDSPALRARTQTVRLTHVNPRCTRGDMEDVVKTGIPETTGSHPDHILSQINLSCPQSDVEDVVKIGIQDTTAE